jgi:modulator of FtsH protease
MADLQPIQSGSFGGAGDLAARQHRVLRNTYLLLALTMIPTIIGAAIGTSVDFSFMRASPGLSFMGMLAVFYGGIFAIEKNKDSGIGVALLLLFTLMMGVLLGPLLQHILGFRNGVQLIMMAAGGTAAVFFVMAGVGASTKRELSGMSRFLTVGAVVIMLAVVANYFLASPVLYLALLAAFVLFSSMVIMWQVNAIVKGGETNYISATLTLYIQVYNLFSVLLQLLGFGGSRD